MKSQRLLVDGFSKQATVLRSFFEKQFASPLKAHPKRFVWDYWNVPDQYRLIRTPAYHYFPKKLYQDFHSALVQWGRENLGCHDISPPWLSYYVEGCQQNLHSDVPHGPWAFVYSLSPKDIKFSGGETFLLKSNLLDYWSNYKEANDREQNSFIEKIESKFNRLVVFDPRVPHGVTEVRGVTDPREARLVIHGWFVEPRPYVVGGLHVNEVSAVLGPFLEGMGDLLESLSAIWGTLSLQLKVLRNGSVVSVKLLTNTLVSTSHQMNEVELLEKTILKDMKKLRFARAGKNSVLVVPLIFK